MLLARISGSVRSKKASEHLEAKLCGKEERRPLVMLGNAVRSCLPVIFSEQEVNSRPVPPSLDTIASLSRVVTLGPSSRAWFPLFPSGYAALLHRAGKASF